MLDGWVVGVDNGGTFTDVVAIHSNGKDVHYVKVLSSRADPGSTIVNALNELEGKGVNASEIHLFLHGTTVITNAIIERHLAKTALITTEGFKDILEIGRHWRKELYDQFMVAPKPLVSRELRLEVEERMDSNGEPITPLNLDQAKQIIGILKENNVEACAVSFLHSYRNPEHEQIMVNLLSEEGIKAVSGSYQLSREIREYERTATTVLNTSLIPLAERYVDRVETELKNAGTPATLYITQSNGGALPSSNAKKRPVTLALSGPVAGVVACTELARQVDMPNLIGLDMGGTSTDISVITDYEPHSTSELDIGGLPVRLPSVKIGSIGAGGGSIITLDPSGALRLGPESAGSEPGPVCYNRGGSNPTVTDCNLILGRLSDQIPLAGTLRLRADLARQALLEKVAGPLQLSVEEAAAGVIEVANAMMEGAVRVALREKGDDPRNFALVAFGGAGALHAVELAKKLSISTVIVPPHPGTFSAYGVLLSDVRFDYAYSQVFNSRQDGLPEKLNEIYAQLEKEGINEVNADHTLEGYSKVLERTCDVRYSGQAYEVNIPVPSGPIDNEKVDEIINLFHEHHERAYGFSDYNELCELVTFRLAAKVKLEKPSIQIASTNGKMTFDERTVYIPGTGNTKVQTISRDSLTPGLMINGPAVIHELDATTYIPEFANCIVDQYGNLIVKL